MSQERKVSVLRALLDRVQARAAAPRAVATAAQAVPSSPAVVVASVPFASASFPVAAPVASSPAPPLVSAVLGTPPASSVGVRAPAPSTPFDLTGGRAPSHAAPPSVSDSRRDEPEEAIPVDTVPPPSITTQEDEDEGPPSAPRLREMPEDAPASQQELDEQELDEDDDEETQLKTPPPESGRQHVTPGPAATAGDADEDISITVTMEESEMPPTVESEPPPEVTASPISTSRPEFSDLNAPPQRLALVSEPEIELHGMTPLSSIVEPIMPATPEPAVRPAEALRHDDIELAVSVSASARSVPPASRPDFSSTVTTPPAGVTPSDAPQAVTATPGAFHSAVAALPAAHSAVTAPPAAHAAVTAPPSPPVSAPPAPPLASPPVRIMAQPLQIAPAQPQAPVEVWASLHAPPALQGRVATFVGQNAKFDPKTFGEVVMASVALGDDDT